MDLWWGCGYFWLVKQFSEIIIMTSYNSWIAFFFFNLHLDEQHTTTNTLVNSNKWTIFDFRSIFYTICDIKLRKCNLSLSLSLSFTDSQKHTHIHYVQLTLLYPVMSLLDIYSYINPALQNVNSVCFYLQ